jgi:DNA-binding PadR family transcriptional regulator
MLKKRFSAEYAMLIILEYLFSNSRDVSLSKYHIMTKVPELKQQRRDRITIILNTLEKKDLITSIETPNATFYRITEKGSSMYLNWVSDFLKFFREIRQDNINNITFHMII